MKILREALGIKWFYVGAMVLGILYGVGGLVHVGNILGYGELSWADAPIAWKMGDIWWGALDMIAFIGILLKRPGGLFALILAAVTQVVVYGLFADAFVLQESHRATIRGMVYFNAVVLVVVAIGVWRAQAPNRQSTDQ